MVSVILNNNKIHRWNQFPFGYVKGFAFMENTLLSEEEIYSSCVDAYNNNRLGTFLHQLNGHFSIVLTIGTETILIADKLKTYPLFYFQAEDLLFVTDTADNVLNKIPTIKLNSLSVKEYLSAGYVSENNTLLDGCQIVSASTYVRIVNNQATEKRYYSQHLLSTSQPSGSLNATVTSILESVMFRMSKVVQDRTIVIPLSAGYDSRLIACLCKKYQFKKVICFTYGIKNSPEVEVSRKVAKQLSFPWYNIEYTKEKWEKLISSSVFEDYMRYGGNLNTIPHIQDFLAITELLDKKLIPTDSVIVPGHTGDVIGGSHFPHDITPNSIGYKLFEKYFEVNLLKRKYQEEIIQYLNQSVHNYFPIDSEEKSLQAFHLWNIRNRQANFIVNSVRAYELHNLDWYLPLWDDEFEQIWNALPCKTRVGSKLYNDLLFEEYFRPYKVDFYKPVSEVQLSLPKRIARKLFPARQRYILKEIGFKLNLYKFKKDRNALDIVGTLIEQKDFNKKNSYILFSKPNSMCMKSLFYLSLLHK